jgi:DNA segregation ATPase FtsK/SpoIIIE-like protein
MNTKLKKTLNWMTTTLLAAALLAFALPQGAAAHNYDPPGRVARIRYLQGSVSFQPAGESDWIPAVTNRPMTIGDQIWADARSRAEIQIGSALIRTSENTGFSFLNLDDHTVQIQLTDGTLNLRVRRLRPGEVFEVDTPNQAFSVMQPGQYRIQASSDGTSSMVTVRQGQGEVTGAGRTYTVYGGQIGTFIGNGTDSLDGQLAYAGDPDDFDNWGQSLDRQYDNSQSARYVSRDVVGYEDLDNNGTWRSDPIYGNVWVPTSVQSGWAPYRYGHWVWISPWGWTWVDDAPWGYAPFHYGRWVSLRGSWGWVPGPINVEPVYAPALVAFIGGPGFAVSIGVGGGGDVGWFPLGPREVYVPGYNVSRGYFDRVNTSNTTVNTTTITNVYNNQVINNTNTNITNITYVNKTVPGAVTAVPQAAFRSSAPVARAAVPVDTKQIASVPVAPRAVVAPTRESVMGTPTPGAVHMARPPAAVATRPVVAKTTPPPPPVPFAKQQQALAKNPGQPMPPQQVQSLRPPNVAAAHPLVKQAPPGKPATLTPSQPVAGNAKQPANAPPPNQPANKPGNAPVANAPNNQAPPVRSDRPPSAQQQQAAQQQAAQQQAAEKARQQRVAQQAADKARQQQAAQQQAAQQAADKARQQQAAQQQAAQQAADKARQQQAAQQQAADKARQQQAAQQQAAQQAADKARQQQAAQQQAAQQAEQARQQQAQQLAAQQAAERAREQQGAQQGAQQQAAQQQADRARQQQAAQQQAAQQQAEKARQQQPAQQPNAQPAQRAGTPPNQPMTPAEKAREEQTKKEEQKPPPPPPQ